MSSKLEMELREALAEGRKLGELFSGGAAPLAHEWPDLNVTLGMSEAEEIIL